jgi:hypothetical protein
VCGMSQTKIQAPILMCPVKKRGPPPHDAKYVIQYVE